MLGKTKNADYIKHYRCRCQNQLSESKAQNTPQQGIMGNGLNNL